MRLLEVQDSALNTVKDTVDCENNFSLMYFFK
jgi:hypothetical protein